MSQAFALDKQIKAKSIQIQELRDLQYSISNTLSNSVVQTSPRLDRLGDLSASIMDLQEEYAKDIDKLLHVKRNIKIIIDSVNDENYKTLLSLRYESLMPWKDVAGKMDYDERWIYRLHIRALKAIEVQWVDMLVCS